MSLMLGGEELVVEGPEVPTLVVDAPTLPVDIDLDEPLTEGLLSDSDVLPEMEIDPPEPIDTLVTPTGTSGEPGPPGPAVELVSEEPLGIVDGVNQTYYTSMTFKPGSTRLYVNGLRQSPVSGYAEVGDNELDLSFAPWPGVELIVDYIRA